MTPKRGCLNSILLTVALLAFAGCDALFPVPPTPPGPVDPIAGSLFVVVVEDISQMRSPETADVLVGASDFWHGLAKRGVEYRWYYDHIGAGVQYGKLTKHRPGLLFVDKSGRLLKELALPKTDVEIDAIVKGFGK